MRVRSVLTYLAFVLCFADATLACAQSIHLPPVYRPSLSPDSVVLTIKLAAANGGHFGTESTVYVHDDNLVINTPKKAAEIVSLDGRTIGDIVNHLQAKYPVDLVVSSNYVLHDARFLAPTHAKLLNQSGVAIKAYPDAPKVNLGFGVVMAMAAGGERSEAQGLLSQTGFQLDVAGIHQLAGTGGGLLGSALYVQARFGLNADQQLAVEREEESPAPGGTAQFEAALEQADQVALTGQLDLVWPIGPPTSQTEGSISLGYGVSWTQLESFEFPLIQVGDSLESAESVFDAARLELARNHVEHTFPISDFNLLGILRFRRSDRPLFYFGGGYARKEILRRGISFQRSSSGVPVPSSVRGFVDTVEGNFWRAVFGARIAGLIDIRIDAVGPFDRDRAPPLLRIVLGRDFPIVQ